MKIAQFLNAALAKVEPQKQRQPFAPITRKHRNKKQYRRNNKVDGG